MFFVILIIFLFYFYWKIKGNKFKGKNLNSLKYLKLYGMKIINIKRKRYDNDLNFKNFIFYRYMLEV